jgi:gamma-glutamylcyclotransferase (GGCT)/AIG2-like uncharacterized protein YtfP
MSEHTTKPLYKFVQNRLDDNWYTKDVALLFKKKWHPVFVYGSLKRGFSKHHALNKSLYLGSAFTRNNGWTMYRMATNTAQYPMIFTPGPQDQPGSIFGEVYLVPPHTIKLLDTVECNGILYNREYRTVDFHTRKGDPFVMAVWMYLSERSTWETQIKSGHCVRCETFTRKDIPNFKYYLYKKDYECPVAQSAIIMQKTVASS